MRLCQPCEHASRCTLKNAVNPRLCATACCVVDSLRHRTRPELADASQIVVQHPLNQRVVIRELRDDIGACALRVLHLHIHRPWTKDVLTHAILKLTGQRVHRVDVVRRDRRVVCDVQEAPAHLVVNACVQCRLLPQLIRLQQRTKDAPAFPLTSRRCAVNHVHQAVSRNAHIALPRREADATHEVGARLRVPEHDSGMRDRVPFNRVPLEHARQH